VPRGKTAFYKQTLFWGCAGAFISLASTAIGLGVSGYLLSMHVLLALGFFPGAWSAIIIADNYGLRRHRRAVPVLVMAILLVGGDRFIVRSQSIPDDLRANLHIVKVNFSTKKFKSGHDGSIIGLLRGTFTLRNSGRSAIKPGALITLGIVVIPLPGLSRSGEDQMYDARHINAGCTESMQSREIFPGDELMFNCSAAGVFTSDQLLGIQAGDLFVYARSRAYIEDSYGRRKTDSCLLYEGPRNRDCMSHNSTVE
jgi:hypothetical protein